MAQGNPADPLNDDPLAGDDAEADHLGRRDFAKSAVGVLQHLRRSGASSVVGLVGPWGGGKTSVLNMIKSMLVDNASNGNDGWLIADFNPWLYQDMATLQMAYFRELTSALPKQGNGRNARKMLAGFANSVAPFGSLLSLVGGPDLSKPVQAVSGLISPDESATKVQSQLEDALRKLGRPVLMVLDDLDRLAPDELLLTLKLIRLIGRLPNVHYIVAYDEDTLLDCLSRTGLVGDDVRRGVDYLEKIIQVRLDVPPVRQHQLDRWIEGALLDLQNLHGLNFEGEAQRRLQHAFYGHIRERLTTPRAVKRYLGQVDAFLGAVHDEIDAVDFLVLTWFRTAEPLVYDMIERERSVLLGEVKNIETADLFGKPDKDRVRQFWEVRLEAARVSRIHMEGVADLIGLLFPRFHAHWNREDTDRSAKADPARRIQNRDYFDRYFAFGVPPEDISDVAAIAALRQIVAGKQGDELTLIESKIASEPDNLALALSKMKAVYERELAGGVELLLWISRKRTMLSPTDDGMFAPERQSRWAAEQIYVLLPEKEIARAIDALAAEADGDLDLASYLVAAAASEHSIRRPSRRASYFDGAARKFAAAVQTRFKEFEGVAVVNVPADTWQLIHDWQIIDQEAASSWLQSRIASGAWALVDVLTRFISRRRIMGVPNAPWTVGDLNIELIDRLLGIDTVIAALDEELAAEHVDPEVRRLEDTYENRRAVALSQMDRERRRRQLAAEADALEPEDK